MKHLSIKARITMLCTLLAAAAAALALSVLIINEQHVVEGYFGSTLASTVQLAMDDIRIEDGRLEIDRNLDDLPNVRVALYNLDGDLIYGQQRFSLEFEENTLREIESAASVRWVVQDTMLYFEEGAPVWLRCYMASNAVQSMRTTLGKILMMLFPGLILLAALGGWLIAGRAFMPINRIIRTAEGIADGTDLKKRIAMTGVQDEIYHTAAVFDDMLERLEGAFERERRFTSDASHELRTPVTAIMAQSEMALSAAASEEDRLEALAEIHRESGHLSTLIQRLLALSRLDARQVLEDAQPVDMAMMAEIAAQSLEERAAEKTIKISAAADAPVLVPGDETMLIQAVLNLAENAVNYGRIGGAVRLEVRCEGAQCRFIVADDGPGISPEDQLRIFDRFYQADASRNGKGFGLGLPLVKRIVELHGGRLELHSEIGKGSSFEMIFPLLPEKEVTNA